jgi:glycosyltransferase involved in cell wall biosynthesis
VKKRVVLIGEAPLNAFKGTERLLVNLGNDLVAKDFDVIYLHGSPEGLTSLTEDPGAAFASLGAKFSRIGPFFVVPPAILRRLNPDVIYLSSFNLFPTVWIFGLPIVLGTASTVPVAPDSNAAIDRLIQWCRSTLLALSARSILHRASVMIHCLNQSQAAYLHRQGFNSNSVLTAGISVNVSFFRPLAELFGNRDEFIVLNVGGIGPRKGGDALLGCAKTWMSRYGPSALFVVVGAGPYSERFNRFEQECSIFRYLGPVTEESKLRLMNRASVLLSTSRDENFSLVAAEAIACGLPVVSADLPGPREFLTNHKNSEIVHGSVDSFVDGLKVFHDRWVQSQTNYIEFRMEIARSVRSRIEAEVNDSLVSAIGCLAEHSGSIDG